jgi:hypothetical protein
MAAVHRLVAVGRTGSAVRMAAVRTRADLVGGMETGPVEGTATGSAAAGAVAARACCNLTVSGDRAKTPRRCWGLATLKSPGRETATAARRVVVLEDSTERDSASSR